MKETDIIIKIYRDLLKRDPDPDGINTYTKLLKKTSKQHVIKVIRNSDEYKNLQEFPNMNFKITPLHPGVMLYEHTKPLVVVVYKKIQDIINYVINTPIMYKTCFIDRFNPHVIEKLAMGLESMVLDNNICISPEHLNSEKISQLQKMIINKAITLYDIHNILRYTFKTKQIVVSRYNETISWLNAHSNVIIYNKGHEINTIHQLINIENIGREGETYLNHIIRNYNNLADYTIFTQADPFEHNKNFSKVLKDHIDKFASLQPLSYCWKESDPNCEWMEQSNNTGIPPKEVRELTTHYWLDCNSPIHVEYLDMNFQCVYPANWTDGGFNIHLIPRTIERNDIKDTVIEWIWRKLNLKTKPPRYIPFCFSALFGVSKERIKNHPVEFYIKLREFLLEHSDHGYLLERLWLFIFGF